jgi:hypothetical protein
MYMFYPQSRIYKARALDLGESQHSLIRHAHFSHIHPHNFPSSEFPLSTAGELYPIGVCGDRIEVSVELLIQHQSCHREGLIFSNSAEGNLPHGESIHTAMISMYSSTDIE